MLPCGKELIRMKIRSSRDGASLSSIALVLSGMEHALYYLRSKIRSMMTTQSKLLRSRSNAALHPRRLWTRHVDCTALLSFATGPAYVFQEVLAFLLRYRAISVHHAPSSKESSPRVSMGAAAGR